MLDDEQFTKLIKAGLVMQEADVAPRRFIAEVIYYSEDYESLYNLMIMWAEAKDPEDRYKIYEVMRDLLSDITESEKRGVHEHGGN